MLKKVGVLAMALASLGSLVPATAAAAERGRTDIRNDARVAVQKRDDRGFNHVRDRRVIVRRTPVRYELVARTCH
jgi:hypothetical protein